jgi:hypothetical protein
MSLHACKDNKRSSYTAACIYSKNRKILLKVRGTRARIGLTYSFKCNHLFLQNFGKLAFTHAIPEWTKNKDIKTELHLEDTF